MRKYSILWITMLMAGLPYRGASAQVSKQRPNFVVVMTDDQGYGDAGYMGNDRIKTPNLDDLAQSGLRLDRFYTAPVCSPTRASVLTGRHPNRTGVFSWGHALRPRETSIAAVLKEQGYQTGFFGKWHLGSLRNGQPTNPGARGFDTWYAAANFYDNDPWMSKNGDPVQLKGEGSDVTVNVALDYIGDAVKTDEPFLVFIWLGNPHLPHQATAELKNLYPGEPEDMQNYLGEITGVDRAIGKLRDRLKTLGIAEETLLWFSSDNGGKLPQASNGKLRGQKGELWEGGIRVPALIEWPGSIAPGASDVPTGAVDLFPTLIALSGGDPETVSYPLDGLNLSPLFEGKMHSREKPLGFWDYREINGHAMKSDQIIQDYDSISREDTGGEQFNEGLLNPPDKDYAGLDQYPYSGSLAWIDNDWKLHQQGEELALYNLAEDPGEEHNVLNQYPEKAHRMKEALRRWQESVIKSIRGRDYHN